MKLNSLRKAVTTVSALAVFGVLAGPAAAASFVDGDPLPVQYIPSLTGSTVKPDPHGTPGRSRTAHSGAKGFDASAEEGQ